MAKEEVLQMTQREIDKVKTLHLAIQRKITQAKAGEILNLCRQQVNRLCQKIKKKGDRAIIHGLRGRPSNHRFPPGLIEKAKKKLKEKYSDFKPTFAAEKLLEIEEIKLSEETVRKLMIELNLWQEKRRRVTHREWRERKDCHGEMVQMDGSDHAWFEGRAPRCVLLATIDDACNRIFLRFSEHEDTKQLMRFSRTYMEKFGRPLSFYVDKDSIFVTNRQPNLEEELQGRKYALTQFTRAMEVDLDVKIINAGSPQAKGRVERLFGTLQDRLVKELRLAGISTIPEANRFLDKVYLAKHNQKFSVIPKSRADLHRPLGKTEAELDEIFSFREERVLGNDYTIHWKNRLFQVEKHQPYFLLPRTRVIVEEQLNGEIKIKYKGKYLKMREINQNEIRKPRKLKPIPLMARPRRYKPNSIPAADHPWRRDFRLWRRITPLRKRQYNQMPQLIAV